MKNTKLYVIVRGDLPPGAQLAQSNHAAIRFCLTFTEAAREWSDASNNIAVLAAPDERALAMLLLHATGRPDVRAVSFREIDLDNSMTAIALFGEPVSRMVSSLPKGLRPPRERAA